VTAYDLERTITVAEREDERLGLRESFGFVGSPGNRIAVMAHIPLGPSRATVVICSSILGDLPKNYRREVGLGRTLAGRGIKALRFHYRGCGNSDGSSAVTGFPSMCEDARMVTQTLTVGGPVAFVGTRMGALIAANVAASWPGAALALLEPVVNAAGFYREGFRARMMRDLKDQVSERPSSERLLAELDEKGVIDVFGYPVDRHLYHSTRLLNLDEQMPGDVRPILLLQMGGAELRSEYLKLGERFAARTPHLKMAIHGQADAWWFLDDQQPSIEQGLEPAAEWLLATIGDS
jgi:pimeloyl-ACP methyl ester carboxylesterase